MTVANRQQMLHEHADEIQQVYHTAYSFHTRPGGKLPPKDIDDLVVLVLDLRNEKALYLTVVRKSTAQDAQGIQDIQDAGAAVLAYRDECLADGMIPTEVMAIPLRAIEPICGALGGEVEAAIQQRLAQLSPNEIPVLALDEDGHTYTTVPLAETY